MKKHLTKVVETLVKEHKLSKEDLKSLLENQREVQEILAKEAHLLTQKNFHNKIYVRGLIEISNFCKNNCYYCGIRKGNHKVHRYRLGLDEIMESVKLGTSMGFQTFVLQGGEDPTFTDDFYCQVIREIKRVNPNTAITLSIGERTYASYEKLKHAGADRFLLRHETKNKDHYQKLHPKEMDLENRIQCLYDLKKLGYQTGTGIMVGSPGQTIQYILEDLLFIQDLKPEMVGIGPYIPHEDTPFRDEKAGSVEETVFLIHLLRLLLPYANIPATTSLNTLSPKGRDRAIQGGANVYMPNLTPACYRKDYALYKDKACFEIEAAENLQDLKKMMKKLGYEVVMARGDFEVKNVQ